MTRSFMMGQHNGMSANMLRTVGSQQVSFLHGATIIKSLSWLLACSAKNLDKLKELMQQEETGNLPQMSKDG